MRSHTAALVFFACTGGGTGPSSYEPPDARAPTFDHVAQIGDTAPAPQIVANIVYGENPTDLIVNGDFEDYQDPNVPAGWSVDEIY